MSHIHHHPTPRLAHALALAACVLSAPACSKSATPVQAPGYAEMAWDESPAQVSDAPDAVGFSSAAAGDQFIWRASMYGIEIGRLSMAVGQPGMSSERQVVVVTSLFESTAAAALFTKIKSMLTTSVDTATSQPVYHRREVESGTPFEWVEVSFTEGEFIIDFRLRSDDGDTRVMQKRNPDVPLFDANSFLLAARTWTLEPGERIAVDIFRENYTWSLQIVRTQGIETVGTSLGSFPTLRYDVIGRSLTRDGSFDQSDEPRLYSFWITDDARRLPIAFIAKTDYGDLRMDLVQYQNQAPSRP